MLWPVILMYVLLTRKLSVNNLNDKQSKKPEYEWQSLDQVCRKWAIMSQFEKDLSQYAERSAGI